MIVGTRHRPAPSLGRLASLMSVIALLALACFPVLAHAEDSSGVQYSDAIPKAEGENVPASHKRPPIAKAADNGGAAAPDGTKGSQGSDESTAGSPEDESTEKSGGVATNGNGGGTGQGSPGGSGNGKANGQVQGVGQAQGTPASQKSDSSSSPLIPILIVILALAAISVGAVMIRQKRQRRGPTASAAAPKAS
jgi:cobalamin biosynthesis Mg chelatase CobN